MKKLLILVNHLGPKKESFSRYLAEQLKNENIKVVLAVFSDLTIYINNTDVCIELNEKRLNIRDFDLIYFRRVGGKYLSLAATLAICLDHLGVKFYDTLYRNVGPARDKFTSYVKLALAGLPMIPSYYCWHDQIHNHSGEIIAKLGLPLVAKQLSSQRGRGVFLIKNRNDFTGIDRFPKEEFLFQKYFPSNEEYRILVMKDQIGAFERKIQTDKTEFRSNVSLGAREEFFDIGKIPLEMKELAVSAAKVLDIQIAGVDVLVDRKGKYWLLEVNRGPGLTYDAQISPELPNIAAFFSRELNNA